MEAKESFVKNYQPYFYFLSHKRDYYFKTRVYVLDKMFIPIATNWLSCSKSNIGLLLRFRIYNNQFKYPEILSFFEKPVLLI